MTKPLSKMMLEIRLVKMDKEEKVSMNTVLGKTLADISGVYDKFQKTTLTGDYSFYFDNTLTGSGKAYVVNREGKVDGYMSGDIHNGVYTIDAADSTGVGPKMPELYKQLLLKGWVNAIQSDAIQSVGGQKIWQRLAKDKDISVHGWNDITGEPVNIGDHEDDDEDLWVDGEELGRVERDERGRMNEPETTDAINTRLVASITKSVWDKLHPRFPKNDVMHRGGQFKKKDR